jgi:hypothetical protein
MRRTHLATAAVIVGAALGGGAIAGAATSSGSGTSSSSTTAVQPLSGGQYGQPPAQRNPALGGHTANGKTEVLLTGDTAAKVKAAALAKEPGATIERVETNVDTSAPYEAHMTKSDGSQIIVYVSSNFTVTGTGTMPVHP